MWEFHLAHSIHLEASDLPGAQNKLADHLSRSFSDHHKWSLCPAVRKIIFQQWGTLHVDLFATRHNGKCHQFCSLLDHIIRSLSDAFLFPWTGHLFYAFPPIPLVHKVLLKIKRDQVRVILIAPALPCQHWFTTLLDLSVVSLIPLPLHPHLISQDHSCVLHVSLVSFHQTAWKLHG